MGSSENKELNIPLDMAYNIQARGPKTDQGQA